MAELVRLCFTVDFCLPKWIKNQQKAENYRKRRKKQLQHQCFGYLYFSEFTCPLLLTPPKKSGSDIAYLLIRHFLHQFFADPVQIRYLLKIFIHYFFNSEPNCIIFRFVIRRGWPVGGRVKILNISLVLQKFQRKFVHL